MVPPGVSRGDRKGFAEIAVQKPPSRADPEIRAQRRSSPHPDPLPAAQNGEREGQLLLDSDRFLLLWAATGLGAIVLPEEDAPVLIHVGQNRIAC